MKISKELYDELNSCQDKLREYIEQKDYKIDKNYVGNLLIDSLVCVLGIYCSSYDVFENRPTDDLELLTKMLRNHAVVSVGVSRRLHEIRRVANGCLYGYGNYSQQELINVCRKMVKIIIWIKVVHLWWFNNKDTKYKSLVGRNSVLPIVSFAMMIVFYKLSIQSDCSELNWVCGFSDLIEFVFSALIFSYLTYKKTLPNILFAYLSVFILLIFFPRPLSFLYDYFLFKEWTIIFLILNFVRATMVCMIPTVLLIGGCIIEDIIVTIMKI